VLKDGKITQLSSRESKESVCLGTAEKCLCFDEFPEQRFEFAAKQ
jgi:hypothetical protein